MAHISYFSFFLGNVEEAGTVWRASWASFFAYWAGKSLVSFMVPSLVSPVCTGLTDCSSSDDTNTSIFRTVSPRPTTHWLEQQRQPPNYLFYFYLFVFNHPTLLRVIFLSFDLAKYEYSWKSIIPIDVTLLGFYFRDCICSA